MRGRFLPSVLVVFALVAGCGDDDGDEAGTTTTTTSAPPDETTTSTTTAVVEPDEGDDPDAEGTDLEDGEHHAELDAVDVEARTISVDVVQFLTGDEAVEAYRAATPEDPEGVPPNDFFIVDENPRLRTLPVADDAVVDVLADPGGPDLIGGALEDLVGRERSTPFVLEIEGGEVVGITQQYLP